jgi:xanthine dehydrogenase accessory factor
MSLKEVQGPLERWSSEGRKAGIATLVRVRRSAPRPPGARFAANEEGDVAGSVSSGCVEADLYEHIRGALEAAEPRIVEYGITDEMAANVGLSCGGEIEVLVAPWQADEVWRELDTVVESKGAAVLLTGLSEGVRGRQLLVFPDGRRVGGLGAEGLDDAAAAAAVPLFDVGGTPVLELEDPEATLFAEAYLPPARLAIVGASPVSAALCHLASYLGIAVTVIDPRKPFAQPERFPDAERIVHAWPDEGFDELGIDRWWSVVVLAHDDKLDVPALERALRAGCLYVGQIGGGRTQRLRREALAERGLDEEAIGRVHGPVGLDIGAESPEEIALSILAELIAVRHGADV